MNTAFAGALLAPDHPPPTGLCSWNGSDLTPRFAVYRNNVATSLAAALADAFPVVAQLVGEAFFNAMARVFVTSHPPSSPVLTEWGDAFAPFLDSFPPVAGLPYLPDMARLERARVRAFHAADAAPLAAEAIAARLADPQALPGARLVLHPSLTVLRSAHAVVSLWAAHQGVGLIGQVRLDQPEAALVLREHENAAVLPVAAAVACFVAQLAAGEVLSDSASAADSWAAASAGAPFDLAESLGLLIRHGVIVGWPHAEESTTP